VKKNEEERNVLMKRLETKKMIRSIMIKCRKVKKNKNKMRRNNIFIRMKKI
jgi:hypothetical protein